MATPNTFGKIDASLRLLEEMELTQAELQYILDVIWEADPGLPINERTIEKIQFWIDRTVDTKETPKRQEFFVSGYDWDRQQEEVDSGDEEE